jgi:2-oxoisovalerate ferredoxin oxidoreductase beta subunit
MSPVFYDQFTRHANGEGLKGHSTHYCPGCGHGLVHRDLAEAIERLGVQDRTVLVSPVGCSVFAYYYFDVGNSQAAHGRAPAVAIGHKLANPEAVVISYQGDGDLAAIGLAETISTAQLGLPITVIFINNAIYGMTGGQMAPTSLLGQKTTTSPRGRAAAAMGQPLRVAEMIAALDGPVYVERVALFDARQRIRARRAIEKALRLQISGGGYAFVEVLAECPTHLKMPAEQAEAWVRDQMVPVFPLGVKKDLSPEPWYHGPNPNYDVDPLLALAGAVPAATCAEPPIPRVSQLDDISLKFAGSGGDGAQTAALLLTRAAISGGFDATHIPSYGPESRGGTSYADVHIAAGEVLSPAAPEPDILIAFNAPSLVKFAPAVPPGGLILYDSSVIPEAPRVARDRRVMGVPFTQIARDLKWPVVKNVAALGALQAATGLLPPDVLLATLRDLLKDKRDLLPVNEAAFAAGQRAADAHAPA